MGTTREMIVLRYELRPNQDTFKIKDATLSPTLTSEQQSSTLHSVLKYSELSSIIQDINILINSSSKTFAKFHESKPKQLK